MARLRILWVGALTIAAGTLNAPVAAYSQQDVWRLDSSESITYFIAEGSAELGFKEGDRAQPGRMGARGVGQAGRSPRGHGAGP